MRSLTYDKRVPPIRPTRFPRWVPSQWHSARLAKGALLFVALSFWPAVAESFESLALVTTRPNPREPNRFLADRTVTVPVLIHAPRPEGLTIRAELLQLTSSLSSRIAGELEVPFSADPAAGSGIELDLSVALPAVSRETGFELRFRSRRQGDRAWQPAGRIPLRVYPVDLLSPVRAWAQSHPLRAEDDHGSLIELFRQQQIPVAGRSSPRGVTLYAGSRALLKQALLPLGDNETAVLFTERERRKSRTFSSTARAGGPPCVWKCVFSTAWPLTLWRRRSFSKCSSCFVSRHHPQKEISDERIN